MMTNEQKNQAAAMNASGMGVDEILIDTGLDRAEVEAFVADRNRLRGKPAPASTKTPKTESKRTKIAPALRQAVTEYYQQGNSERRAAIKFGIAQSTVHRILTKEKEPTAVAPATDSENKTLQVNTTTISAESQALRGVGVLGVLQPMVDDWLGKEAEVMSLKADSDTAQIVFRYEGGAYEISFGTAF